MKKKSVQTCTVLLASLAAAPVLANTPVSQSTSASSKMTTTKDKVVSQLLDQAVQQGLLCSIVHCEVRT